MSGGSCSTMSRSLAGASVSAPPGQTLAAAKQRPRPSSSASPHSSCSGDIRRAHGRTAAPAKGCCLLRMTQIDAAALPIDPKRARLAASIPTRGLPGVEGPLEVASVVQTAMVNAFDVGCSLLCRCRSVRGMWRLQHHVQCRCSNRRRPVPGVRHALAAVVRTSGRSRDTVVGDFPGVRLDRVESGALDLPHRPHDRARRGGPRVCGRSQPGPGAAPGHRGCHRGDRRTDAGGSALRLHPGRRARGRP